MPSFLLKPLLGTAVLTFACMPVQAQSFDAVRLQGEPSGDGEGRIGLAAIAGYQYMGSDERRYMALPTVDYRWKSGWFAGVINGIGYRFASNPKHQYGLRLAGDFGRSEGRSAALRGLGDIHARPEAGAFFNTSLSSEFSLSTSLRYGAGNDRHGLLADLGLHYGTPIAPQWRLGSSITATYANRNYMQGYFGITPEQSAGSGYAVYEAGAGIRDLRVGGALVYFINRDWVATVGLSVGALLGDAKNSPIVREDSPVSGVLAVSCRF